jgi:hypothetical protein
MSDSPNLLSPLGPNTPLPGSGPGRNDSVTLRGHNISLRGPDMPHMQRLAAQPAAQINPGANAPGQTAGGLEKMDFNQSRDILTKSHKFNVAMYKEIGQQLKKVDAIRKSLDKLSEKQDMVTMEDIVAEAGKLVSHGLDPIALAGILADAPQTGGGEALGGWIADHAQTAAQGEQQLIMQHEIFKHKMGVSAMHLLLAHHNGANLPPQTPVDEGNELSPPPQMASGQMG